MAPRRYHLDEDRPRSVIEVWGDEGIGLFNVGIHTAQGSGIIEGSREALALRLHRVLDALSPPPHLEPPQVGNSPNVRRCTRCGSSRLQSGVCFSTSCADPSYDLRVETGRLFLVELERLGASPRVLRGLSLVVERLVKGE